MGKDPGTTGVYFRRSDDRSFTWSDQMESRLQAAHVAIGAEGYSEYARGLSASIPSTWRTWREARAAPSMRCQNVMGAS